VRSQTLAAGVAALTVLLPAAACGDDDSPQTAPPGAIEVLAYDNLSFDQDRYEAQAGTVTFFYRNEGRLPHTLLVHDVDDFELRVGNTDQGSVDLEAGTYELYCDIPGHEQGGMVAELEVT
jgi:plastocyanin